MIHSVLEPFSLRSTMQAETQKQLNQRCTSWPGGNDSLTVTYPVCFLCGLVP